MNRQAHTQIEGVFIVNDEIKAIIRRVQRQHSRNETQVNQLKIKIADLLLAAMDHVHPDKPMTNFAITPAMKDKAQQAVAYLALHLKDNFGAADVARHVGTNIVSLNKAFKHCFRTTVAKYSRTLRLTHAQHLIVQGKLDMNAIADETGYCDGAALHHAFVAAFGIGPMKFRVQHGKNNSPK